MVQSKKRPVPPGMGCGKSRFASSLDLTGFSFFKKKERPDRPTKPKKDSIRSPFEAVIFSRASLLSDTGQKQKRPASWDGVKASRRAGLLPINWPNTKEDVTKKICSPSRLIHYRQIKGKTQVVLSADFVQCARYAVMTSDRRVSFRIHLAFAVR